MKRMTAGVPRSYVAAREVARLSAEIGFSSPERIGGSSQDRHGIDEGRTFTPAEWLIDNYRLVEGQIREIRVIYCRAITDNWVISLAQAYIRNSPNPSMCCD